MIVLVIVGLLFLALAVGLLARAFVAPTSRSAARVAEIEAYGFSGSTGSTGPAPHAGPSGITALAARIGASASERFGQVSEADLRSELMAAGMYTTSPRALLGYRVLAAMGLPLLMLLLGAASDSPVIFVLLAAAAAVIGWMGPLFLVRRRARTRLDRVDRMLPDLVDILVVTIEAGLGFSGALRVAARELTGPLGDELRLTLQEETMGLSTTEALTNMLKRADTPSMRSFVRGVIQGETLGVSMGTIMRNLAVEMRRRRRQAAEELAQKAPVKLLFPLVFFIFPTIFIVLLVPAFFKLQDAFS